MAVAVAVAVRAEGVLVAAVVVVRVGVGRGRVGGTEYKLEQIIFPDFKHQNRKILSLHAPGRGK